MQGTTYHITVAWDHPLALQKGHVKTARLVLYEKIGPGPHPCHWCGLPLEWRPGNPHLPDALFVDHLDSNRRHNAPSNLVPSCCPCNVRRANQKGECNPAAKLTDDAVRAIRARYRAGGVTQKALADEYGVRFQAISKVVRGDRWKHVHSDSA